MDVDNNICSMYIFSSNYDCVASAGESGYKRVCTISNWDISSVNKIIDPVEFCTHVLYYNAVLNTNTSQLNTNVYESSLPGIYNGVRLQKSTSVKELMTIGINYNEDPRAYRLMVADKSKRKIFIKSAISFLKRYEFDGLNLDWEYPVCWNEKCQEGFYSGKREYATFVQELKKAFNEVTPPLILTSALPSDSTMVNNAYDVPSLSRNVDFFIVSTYDYRGAWDDKTGHHAQLLKKAGDDDPKLNIDYTIRKYLYAGFPARKLVVGIALYGIRLTLWNGAENGLNAPLYFRTTKSDRLGFSKICRLKKDGWTKVVGDDNVGPYAYKDEEWISYLDVDAVAKVAEYVKRKNLGGAMLMRMDFDDHNKQCCSTTLPLHTVVKKVLTGTGPSVSQIKSTCPL
ncbi:CHIT1 (predicted) [Pycnogonum litorale]